MVRYWVRAALFGPHEAAAAAAATAFTFVVRYCIIRPPKRLCMVANRVRMIIDVRGEERVGGAVVDEEDAEDVFGPLEGLVEVVAHALEGELGDRVEAF